MSGNCDDAFATLIFDRRHYYSPPLLGPPGFEAVSQAQRLAVVFLDNNRGVDKRLYRETCFECCVDLRLGDLAGHDQDCPDVRSVVDGKIGILVLVGA